MVPGAQYDTDVNLAARQRLWSISRREPEFDLYSWVLRWVEGCVLEVGCGNGRYLGLLPGATGMDLSAGMLGAARQRVTNPLVCGDTQALPFRDDAFDTVLAPHMLYHVPDRRQAARELRRVLRPDGVCVAVSNSGTTHSNLVAMVEEVVGTGWKMQRPSDKWFSMENGAEHLRAGFDTVEEHWAPDVTYFVTDANAYGDYIGSIADPYEAETGRVWSEVAEECRGRAAQIIERDGSLPILARLGAFVCR